MPLITRQTSRAFSSSPANGAQNVSADGSSYSVTLQRPLVIPPGALDAELACLTATVWNTSPNISAAFGNNIFTYTTATAPAGTYTVNILEGLYSLTALSGYISNALVNNGHPAGLFGLAADDATQRSIVIISNVGDSVDLSVANSVAPILGFGAVVLTATVAGARFYSTSTAAFNRVDQYLIRSNIVAGGLPVNANTTGIVANIPITVSPGSQIVYEPTNPIWVDATDLIASGRQNLDFALVDQLGRATPTAGEIYSCVLALRWTEWAPAR
jgi:hypothetical protein